jgi:hypothetical protein
MPIVGIAIAWITSRAETTSKISTDTATATLAEVEIPINSPIEIAESRVWSDKAKIQYHWIPKMSMEAALTVPKRIPTAETIWFSTITPAVGITSDRNSTLREETAVFAVEMFSELFSFAAKMMAKTAKKIPAKMAQIRVPERKTVKKGAFVVHLWVFLEIFYL